MMFNKHITHLFHTLLPLVTIGLPPSIQKTPQTLPHFPAFSTFFAVQTKPSIPWFFAFLFFFSTHLSSHIYTHTHLCPWSLFM